MNTPPRSNLPLFVILGLVVLSTLALAVSLTSLTAGANGPAYSAPRLYNQANADFQKGKTGEAIANYERARLLAPSDPDIAANLDWVRGHAGLPSAAPSWLDRPTSWASPNTMAFLGWLGLVLTGAGYLSAMSFPRRRALCQMAAFAGVVLLGLSVMSAVVTWQKCHEAVVVAQDAAARISPVTDGETAFKLSPGETVALKGSYHDFALVQTSAGHSGWVAQTDITPIVPQ
jgi:hypothetical protein